MRRFVLALALCSLWGAVRAPAAWADVALDGEAAPDHLSGSRDELAGWSALQESQYVKARELGEKIVREHPDSYAGHYVLGVAFHYGEGDLARSEYQLDLAMKLFEATFGATPPADAPWRWHEATLKELAYTFGEMDRPAEELRILDKYDAAYNPKRIAQRVWPLMKLRRYDESRRAAAKAQESGDPAQRSIARSDLCAAECEAGDRQQAYATCVAALGDYGQPGTGGMVEYANASEAAMSMFRYDETERFLIQATQRASAESWGDPFQHLAELYLTEARIPEAIAAVKGAQDLRMRRAAWLDQHGQSHLDGTLAELFLLVGVSDRAVAAAERAVRQPDRTGVHSGTQAQEDAAAAVRLAVALHDRALREEEDAVTSSFKAAVRLRARALGDRLASWRARRRVAVLLADEPFLVKSLRPYYVGGMDMTMWLVPDALDMVGAGVAEAALERARAAEREAGNEAGAAPYFDALALEIAWGRGGCDEVLRDADGVLRGLPAAEALLRGRMAVVAGECARRSGDEARAAAYFLHALQRDPSNFRRLSLALPVRVETDGSELASHAARLVDKSPRFRVSGGAPFHVVLRGGQQPEACLQGPTRERLACAHVNLPVDTAPDAGARLLIAEFHKVAFALKADLTQADLTSLDGSPTQARADRQVQSLIDLLGDDKK